jgi:hypothetical protein
MFLAQNWTLPLGQLASTVVGNLVWAYARSPDEGQTMRKLVLIMGVSLDGLVARPGKFGGGGWGCRRRTLF